ncbi:hypothetical protein, partial [Novosphingobium sp. NDB2Meth1]|uniref:hypothetical protein n=1 Tax=Novosphingobium sp. NDB2Meth1 TaxID=1892847 RepID=UPI001C0C9C13
RAILSSVIVFFSRFEFASEPYQKIDGGHPLRETFLHHPVGHDRSGRTLVGLQRSCCLAFMFNR